MRTLLTIILTCFISFLTMAQSNVNLKKMVGFGCYSEGRYTKPVVKVTKLLEAKNYKAISKLLTSRNNGEKYLAVITLQRLVDKRHYNLNDKEKDLIARAKSSNAMVSVCSGCTYFDKVPMKKILKENNFFGSKFWLERFIQ